MSYTIIKTNGTVLTTIADGTLNTTSTSIALPGRLYPGYGQVIDTDLVHVLENFAYTSPPANPLQGQLWFNTNTNSLCICPTDGETNAAAWYTVITSSSSSQITAGNITVSGNVDANNFNAANTVTANLVDTDYLTVNIQANIANANVTGNANLANVLTANITTGAQTTLGNLTGAWTVTGNATLGGLANTAMRITGGNLVIANTSSRGIVADNFYYSNGTPISFSGTYSNSNVISYLPLYTGTVGTGATFNGLTLTTGANTTSGTLTGNWTLSSGSKLNGVSVDAANVVGAVATATAATTAGTVTNATQGNITSVGTLSTLGVSGTVTASRFVSNVATGTAPLTVSSTTKVTNLNADYLGGYQTDVSNTASTIALRDTGGNIAANYFIGNGALLTGLNFGTLAQIINGSSNVSIPASGGNVNISIGGTANTVVAHSAGLNVTGNIIAGNINVTGISGALISSAQPNITSVGTLSSLTATGNITGANINGNIYGNGAGLTNVPAASINGIVQYANYSTYAGAITLGPQPNITSTGTLTSVNSSGNVTAPNVIANTGAFYGSGAGLTNIPAGSIVGTVTNATNAVTATTAGSATTAGTVTTPSQPNITSVGALTSLTVLNKVTAGQLQGDGGNIGNLRAASVVGTVATSTYATSAGSATTATSADSATYATSAGTASTVSSITSSQVTTALGYTPYNSSNPSSYISLSSFTQNFNQGGTAGLIYGGTNYGWTQLPNGLIIQWGNNETFHSGEGAVAVAFPVTFPNMVLTVVAVDKGQGYGNVNDDMWVQVPYIYNTGCYIMYQSSSSGNSGYGYRWIAIGY